MDVDSDFVQANVRVPKWAKVEVTAIAAMYRGQHYLDLASSDDMDVIMEVANSPTPKMPQLVEFADARKEYSGKVAEYAERGYDLYMRYQRQVGIFQMSKVGSEEHIRASALMVGYGKMVCGLYAAMKAAMAQEENDHD